MAALKKPKMLKYPKKPRRTASADTLKRYLERVKEIDKENKRRMAAYKKEKQQRESLRKKIDAVRR